MSDEIQEKLKALTAAYSAQLPSRVREIESGWAAVKQHGDKDQLAILARNAHTLCGTAGTYGYTLVSEVARKLEKYFNDIKQKNVTNQIEIEVDNLMQDLQQLALNTPEKNIISTLPTEKKIKRKNRSIYILEKDKITIESQFEQIKQFNYTVKVFDKISDFLRSVNTDKPDMVIIDVSFAKNISADSIKNFRDELILIVFTGNQDELMHRLLAVRHGGQAFVIKPFEVNTLLRTIDNLFEARDSQNERILIVDDSEFLADYYSMLLNDSGMLTEKVIHPKIFLSKLQEFQPDLILMDVNMPFCSGTELAQIVHQQENLSGIPIIFLSSITEKSKQLEVLSFAGDDFITKPVEPKYLLATVRNRLMRSHMLRSRMMRDSLTNLYNHTMIHHQLEREILIAGRYHKQVCIALFDIDHFKLVNDIYGHQAGDKILKALSLFLESKLRKSDSVGRYGGEEFLVVLPNTNSESAFEIVNDLREQFASTPHWIDDKELFVAISGGIASFPEFKKVSDLVKAADEALYSAKEQGRNRIILADVS